MSKNRFAFVIRLWNETNHHPGQPADMRGSLQMASSDKVVYFRSLEQIPEILRGLTGWTGPANGNPPASD